MTGHGVLEGSRKTQCLGPHRAETLGVWVLSGYVHFWELKSFGCIYIYVYIYIYVVQLHELFLATS